MDYGELLAMFDQAAPDGRHYHDTAYSLVEFSDEAIDAMVASAAARTSPFSAVLIHRIHGAATRLPSDATAFALRYPHYAIINSAAWEEGDGQAHIDWAEGARVRMAPYAAKGVYVNFLGDDGEPSVRASYGANYRRLAEIKNRYDPENFFRLNQNITPKK
jgi:hypothetical protein